MYTYEPCSKERGSSILPLNQPFSTHARSLSKVIIIVSVSLPQVYPWPTAYMSEQHRIWQDYTNVQVRLSLCCSLCYNNSFSMTQLRNILSWRLIMKYFTVVILSLQLIQKGQLWASGKRMHTKTSSPLRGLNLPRKSVVRKTDRAQQDPNGLTGP